MILRDSEVPSNPLPPNRNNKELEVSCIISIFWSYFMQIFRSILRSFSSGNIFLTSSLILR
ncbi:hypothetical protein C5167_041815 [Papaver somniferum]|nr:hypothetical protein C5167_041815 [Papaver somniferum]